MDLDSTTCFVPTRNPGALATAALAVVTGLVVGPGVEARKKRKRKKRKVKKATPNAFGCLEVDDPCTSADECCSTICDGKKGKKRCRAHGAGTCEQGVPGICTNPDPFATFCNNSTSCVCARTTADSNFCGTGLPPSDCTGCQTDADCDALGFPPGSACASWSSGNCVGLCETGMVCLAPCGVEHPEPTN